MSEPTLLTAIDMGTPPMSISQVCDTLNQQAREGWLAPVNRAKLLSASDICARLRAILDAKQPIGWDVEGSQWVTCQAFAETPRRAFVIVTDRMDDQTREIWQLIRAVLESRDVVKWVWNAHHELAVMQLAHGIHLRNWEDGMAVWFEHWPELPKGLKYAASILTRIPYWAQGISFENDDSGEAKAAVRGPRFYLYNAWDAASTLELAQHPQMQISKWPVKVKRYPKPEVPLHSGPGAEEWKEMTEDLLDSVEYHLASGHKPEIERGFPTMAARYALRKRLIEALTWMSLRGIHYDKELAERLRGELTPRMWEAQAVVDELAGVRLPGTADELLVAAAQACCNKTKLRKLVMPGDVITTTATPLPPVAGKKRKTKVVKRQPLTWDSALQIANETGREPLERIRDVWIVAAPPEAIGPKDLKTVAAAARGELASLLDLGINVKSTPQVTALLDRLKLPKVFKRGEAGNEDARTKNEAALLDLYLRTGHPITTALLSTIHLRTQLQECDRKTSRDGRMRAMFLSCGTETDRTTCKTWLDGTGGRMHVVPSAPVNFRRCFPADPGYDWGKLDLTGADAWTYAARCASLGDPTMLEDLKAGLRIPTLLAMALASVPINKLSRDELKQKSACFYPRDQHGKEMRDWRDIAFKRGTYGTFFGMTPQGVRRQVIGDSYAELGAPKDPGLELCKQVQQVVLSRYWGIPLYHRDIERQLKQDGGVRAASGLFREFFGRRLSKGRIDDATRREAYAFECQANTTYLINLGLDALWTDVENRELEDGDRGVTCRSCGFPQAAHRRVSSACNCQHFEGELHGEPIIWPLLPVHDELCSQWPSERRAWALDKYASYFTRDFTIGKVTVRVPFVLKWGESWGTATNL